MSSLQKHGVLSLNQHGYLPKRGTDNAYLQLLNTLETAWDEQRPLYGCSWDMKKAFYSVAKPLILLCWRLHSGSWTSMRLDTLSCAIPSPLNAGTSRDLQEPRTSLSTLNAAPVKAISTAPSPGLRCSTSCLPCLRTPPRPTTTFSCGVQTAPTTRRGYLLCG